MESEACYEVVANKISDTARESLVGVPGRRSREDKETWWWSEEIHLVAKEKKDAMKLWDVLKDDESKERYNNAKKKTKRTVAKAKNEAFQELYERLETKEGVNDVLRIAKQRHKNGQGCTAGESDEE